MNHKRLKPLYLEQKLRNGPHKTSQRLNHQNKGYWMRILHVTLQS